MIYNLVARLNSHVVSALCAVFAISLTVSSANAAGPHIAVDLKSGRVISHEQAFQKWYPASLTKLMTAYVTFREIKSGRLRFDSTVTMSRNAASEPASKMYFSVGTQFSVDSAMKYILVKSANDVAVALAEAVGGSESNFIVMMNREAKRLGMSSSRFINPHGLPGSGQYTTARDMALLGVALRKEFPKYKSYFALEGFSTGKKKYTNYNILLGRYSGADGMKTGFICASGFNLVGSATRNGRTIISVVLGAKSQVERAELAASLLQAGMKGKKTSSTLKSLKAYGANRNQLANIRGQICTQEARAARYDGRDVDGKIVLKSPYLKSMTRNSKIVSAPYTNASAVKKSGGTKLSQLKNIPIPVPRPIR
jgi:D-alanyl-D-alanine carboxypeptidase